MPNFCTQCGNSLPEHAQFCTSCGSPVIDRSQQSHTDAFSAQSQGISPETMFASASNELSELFAYNKCGKEFTGDLGYVKDRIRSYIAPIPMDVRKDVAETKMAEVRTMLPEFSKDVNDENWERVNRFMKVGLPVAITAYFFDEGLGRETGAMMQRLREFSDLRWDKTNFLGKAAVPSAKFEDVFTLRYIMRNLKV